MLSSENRTELFTPALPALVRVCEAFPPLVDDVVSLLLQVGRVCLSEACAHGSYHPASLTPYDDHLLVGAIQQAFIQILTHAVLKVKVYWKHILSIFNMNYSKTRIIRINLDWTPSGWQWLWANNSSPANQYDTAIDLLHDCSTYKYISDYRKQQNPATNSIFLDEYVYFFSLRWLGNCWSWSSTVISIITICMIKCCNGFQFYSFVGAN